MADELHTLAWHEKILSARMETGSFLISKISRRSGSTTHQMKMRDREGIVGFENQRNKMMGADLPNLKYEMEIEVDRTQQRENAKGGGVQWWFEIQI